MRACVGGFRPILLKDPAGSALVRTHLFTRAHETNRLFAHGKPPWDKIEKAENADVPVEPDRFHKQLMRWAGMMGVGMAGVVLKMTEGDVEDKEGRQKDMLQALAALFGAGFAMDAIVCTQDPAPQSDNATALDAGMATLMGAACFLASRDEKDDDGDAKDKK